MKSIKLKSAADLGWEINLEVEDGCGKISSNLTTAILGEVGLSYAHDEPGVEGYLGAVHGIESVVLALACAGFDNQDMLTHAVDTAVEAICNNFD